MLTACRNPQQINERVNSISYKTKSYRSDTFGIKRK